MELTDYLRILRKYWISILAVTVGGIAVAGAASLLMRPVYTASASIFFTVHTTGTAGELNQGSTYAANQVKSYAQLATTPIVLEPVISQLGLETTAPLLAESITAAAPTSTAIINIDVTGKDAEETARISNAVAQQLIVVVDQLSPQTQDGTKVVRATIVSPASVPIAWTSPRVNLNLALGGLIGLMLGLGQAVLRRRLDTRVVGADDIEEVTDRSVVGAVVFDPDAAQHPLIFQADPHSARAETYRRLRTNLQFLDLGARRRSIVVTSSVEGEGKSTTSINLASTLADAGESVLLIDADLRRPMVASYLNIEGTVGLTTVMIGKATLADVVQPIGQAGLHVLPAGQIPPNPSELLGSESMRQLLKEATETYDMVIVDSPPLLPVTDSAVLSRAVGGTLLVVGSGKVRKPELDGALESLEAVDANILGLVLNRVRTEDVGHYRYHQHYAPTGHASQPQARPAAGRRAHVEAEPQ